MSATRRPLLLAAAFLVREGRTAIRYGLGGGRAGFTWSGTALVKRKATQPGWRPTEALLKRRPTIPRDVAVKTATPEVMMQREWDDRPRSDNQVILFR